MPKKGPEPLRKRSQKKPVLSTFLLLCLFVFLDTDDQRRLFPNSSILTFAPMKQTPSFWTEISYFFGRFGFRLLCAGLRFALPA